MAWYYDIETDIFTQVKYRLNQALLTRFPDLYITMDDAIIQEPQFPTVYIHFMQSVEEAQTLENTSVNAINCTIQFEVTVSKEQGMNAARIVMAELTTAFKQLAFSVVSLATFTNSSQDTKRMVGRCRRMIGNGDILN